MLGSAGVVAISTLKNKTSSFSTRSSHPKWGAFDARKSYCINHSNIADTPELAELRELTSQHKMGVMEATPDVGQFLVLLMKLLKAKNIVEVGSFTGVLFCTHMSVRETIILKNSIFFNTYFNIPM